MASPDKRCLYEVLGVSRDCSPDEIRSAYKKLALQRHPDKLVQSGVPESEATAAFQELVNAYEVLSDPRERSWYDSNRSKILFSSSTSGPNSSSKFGSVPNLFSFFSNSVYSGFSDTGKGFYKVYADVFDKVYNNEVNFAKMLGLNSPKEAPVMGNSNSPYAQVTAFYNYWLGFTTVMDFCWVDQYDAMAGINRKSRRVMEDENKKLRKKARREFNETVRGLAEFVKKRDKRVIDMQVKRNEEMERKREEDLARRKELERLKEERAKKYKEPDWTQVEDVEDEAEETLEEDDREDEGNELYCIACGKRFKSEKQWKNHEQSKKHKEKVAALREAFSGEDKEFEEVDVNGRKEEEKEEQKTPEADESGYFSATDDAIDELGEQFEGSFGIQGKSGDGDGDDDEEFETAGKAGYTSDGQDSKAAAGESGSDDDEASILEAMVSGHRSRKNAVSYRHSKIENDDNEMDFMEYNNMKSSGRKRGSRKQRGRRAEEEMKLNKDEPSGQAGKNTGYDENLDVQRSPKAKTDGDRIAEEEMKLNEDELGQAEKNTGYVENLDVQRSPKAKTDGKEDDSSEMIDKIPRQVNKRGNTKKDNNTKSKNASKGRKEKTASKVSSNACEKCGEEFESRTKLHKHLGETGHASLKKR